MKMKPTYIREKQQEMEGRQFATKCVLTKLNFFNIQSHDCPAKHHPEFV